MSVFMIVMNYDNQGHLFDGKRSISRENVKYDRYNALCAEKSITTHGAAQGFFMFSILVTGSDNRALGALFIADLVGAFGLSQTPFRGGFFMGACLAAPEALNAG